MNDKEIIQTAKEIAQAAKKISNKADLNKIEGTGLYIVNLDKVNDERKMTANEALEQLNDLHTYCFLTQPTSKRMVGFEYTENFFIQATEALEKQIPFKPKEYEDRFYACKCGNILLMKWKKYPMELTPKSEGLPYCLGCGQKLDWSDEE